MQNPRKNFAILLFFACILMLHHFVSYLGHFGYDDIHYAKLANDLSNGIFSAEDHYSFRLSLIGLTSLFYQLLGINDFSSALPALLASIVIQTIVFTILRDKKPLILFFGLALSTLTSWNLFYSDKLMPDVLVALFSLVAIYLFFRYKFGKGKTSPIWLGIGVSFALFLGFNSKGTIILIAPLFLYYFIIDLIQKRNRLFWIYTIVSSVFLMLTYFLFFEYYYGNGLIRFRSIVNNGYLNLCSYDQQPFIFTLKRISYELIFMFIKHGLIVPLILIFAYGKGILKKDFLLLKSKVAFFVISSLVLLFSSNFMTISLRSYSPMCLDPRHYLFITPIAAIASAWLIENVNRSKLYCRTIFTLSSIIFGIALILGYDSSWTLYFPICITSLLFLFVKKHEKYEVIFTVLFFLTMLIIPIKMTLYARKINFKKQEQIFKDYFLDGNESKILITDQVQKNLGLYFNSFDENKLCQIITYDEFDPSAFEENQDFYILKNWYTYYLTQKDESQVPYYAKITDNYKKIYEDAQLNIQIFKIDQIIIPNLIFELYQNFESAEIEHWSNFTKNETEVYSGSASSLLSDYSSTFRIPIDSIRQLGQKELIINSSLHLKLIDEADPIFVISFDKDGENKFWKGIQLKPQIKSYGNWNSVSISESSSIEEIPSGSTLSIYIWNKEKEEIYLDDFKIEILDLTGQDN